LKSYGGIYYLDYKHKISKIKLYDHKEGKIVLSTFLEPLDIQKFIRIEPVITIPEIKRAIKENLTRKDCYILRRDPERYDLYIPIGESTYKQIIHHFVPTDDKLTNLYWDYVELHLKFPNCNTQDLILLQNATQEETQFGSFVRVTYNELREKNIWVNTIELVKLLSHYKLTPVLRSEGDEPE
jgi:hypothetical protein